MGYQALLFCPDEKLSRVVSQVFTELDFVIESVHEPFAAVKKLMSQRYDAIVVDCENEQNASLLFKSARNSSSNQSSLAIALVEGQAGVAKSYRIGANLVLTKPINVEQAKGTLRVARGLLRKNAEAASPNGSLNSAAAAKAAPPAAEKPAPKPIPDISEVAQASDSSNVAEFEKVGPKLVPPAPAAAPPVALAVMSSASQEEATKVTETKSEAPVSSSSAPQTIPQTAPATPKIIDARLAFGTSAASSAAPAPAKEIVSPPAQQNEKTDAETARSFRDAPHNAPEFTAYESAPTSGSSRNSSSDSSATISTHDAPSFGSVYEENSAGGSGGSKKILVAACVLGAAVLGYFGYQKFAGTTAISNSQAMAARPASAEPALPPAPSSSSSSSSLASSSLVGSSSAHANSTSKLSALKPATPSSSEKLSGTTASSSPISATSDDEPEIKIAPAPVHVKSSIAAKKQSRAEEVAPPLPSAIASSSPNNLSSLIASPTPTMPKPTLATVRISQGVSQGLLIKRVPPKYPPAARATHTQGEVRIEATINKEGNVVNPKVLRGDAVLAHAALEAVRQWRYKPYYLDGAPVEIQTEITINFKAD
jgi:TonB family protein